MVINIFFILTALCMLATLLVLMTGIGAFGKSNRWYRNHANQLMRWRVYLQFLAIIFFFLYMWSIGR